MAGDQSRPSAIPSSARFLADDEKISLIAVMAHVIDTSHLFRSLDEEGRHRTLESGYVESFARGTRIITEGEVGTTMYMVLRGRVRVETSAPGGPLALAELSTGGCFGEVAVLSGGPRTATVTAVTDVDCVTFERHRVDRILEDYPKIRQVLEMLVEGRARDTVEKLITRS